MFPRRPFTILAATLGLVVPTVAAASLDMPSTNADSLRGWSAVAGMDTTSVMDMAATVFPGEAGELDAPYCDTNPAISRTLSQDFGESLVDTAHVDGRNAQLWGSPVLGTWTLVLTRADATSCIVASGIGYSDSASPDLYYIKAGFDG